MTKNSMAYDTKTLTEFEIDVLRYICMGYRAKEVAKMEFRSPRTIEGIRNKMFEKTGTKNITTLIAWVFLEWIMQ